MVYSFNQNQSLADFQTMINDIYGLTDDRLYSLWDISTQQQRFSMRALKGIRKQDKKKIKVNLLIAFCWTMTIANRLHINLDDEVRKRFPNVCSYCGKSPCVCKKTHPAKRKKVIVAGSRLESLAEMQKMFERIYPSKSRTLPDAGIHFAEEMGEVSEAIHNYLGQHKDKLFNETKVELADYVSCTLGVANSAGVNIAEELEKMFYKNCHVCHHAPCTCTFSSIASFSA